MIPFDAIVVVPSPGRKTVVECLRRLEELPLALTFFVAETGSGALRRRRAEILGAVEERFGGDPPPWSVVAQPPADGADTALSALLPARSADGARISFRRCEGIPYAIAERGGARQLHGACLASDGPDADTAASAREAFARMGTVLAREGMNFGHVVRQWGYVEGILDVRCGGAGGRQGYQCFNDARTLAYGGSTFDAGFPAATAIGQATGGVLLEFIALDPGPDVRIAPLSNPRQVDAHRYSDRVLVGDGSADLPGKTAPKFERAKRVTWDGGEVILVSGTAAIVGERSVAPSDVTAQTETTIENIAALTGGLGLTHLRAYVKRAGDIPAVREVCEAAYGPIPALYVRADVCRDELLVEIEGAVVSRALDAGATREENAGRLEGGSR